MSYADTLSFINYFLLLILIYKIIGLKDKFKKLESDYLDKIEEINNGKR